MDLGWFGNLGRGLTIREDSYRRVGWELSGKVVDENLQMSRSNSASRRPDQFQLLLELTAQSADLFEDLPAGFP